VCGRGDAGVCAHTYTHTHTHTVHQDSDKKILPTAQDSVKNTLRVAHEFHIAAHKNRACANKKINKKSPQNTLPEMLKFHD